VDVDDTARLHVATLISKSINNERILAFAKPYTWKEVLSIMREVFPSRNFPEDIQGLEKSNLRVPNERGEGLLKEIFGRDGWTTLEETIRKNLKGLV
jgi:hypothetical protein